MRQFFTGSALASSAFFKSTLQKKHYSSFSSVFPSEEDRERYRDENKKYPVLLNTLQAHKFDDALEQLKEIEALSIARHEKARKQWNPFSEYNAMTLGTHSDFMVASQIAFRLSPDLKDALTNCAALLRNPSLCIDLLKELDEEIVKFSPFLGLDYSAIKPESVFFVRSFQVPCQIDGLTAAAKTVSTDSDGLLWYLLRKIVNKQGIDTENTLLTFSGYVNKRIANDFVKEGRLFREHFLSGSVLMHGIYSHYIQWALFSIAIEKKILNLGEDITLPSLMDDLIFLNQWDNLIDFISNAPFNTHCQDFNLGSPQRLNSLLLFSDELPNLRGLMLTLFYQQTTEIQNQFALKYKKTLPYRCLVGGHASALGVDFEIGFNQKDIKNYLDSYPYSFSFDEETGVITENADKRFAKFIEIEKNMVTMPETRHGRYASI